MTNRVESLFDEGHEVDVLEEEHVLLMRRERRERSLQREARFGPTGREPIARTSTERSKKLNEALVRAERLRRLAGARAGLRHRRGRRASLVLAAKRRQRRNRDEHASETAQEASTIHGDAAP